MHAQSESQIACPYCGESSHVLLDPSVDEQEYIEDCQVCCCPIIFQVSVDHDGDCFVTVKREDE